MAKFINSYNFVPVDPDRVDAQRQQPVGFQHRFPEDRLSGRLHCSLTTLTCVFTPDSKSGGQVQQKRFNRRSDGLFTIPGSSLKGVLRMVTEAISNSCFTIFSEDGYKYWLLNRGLASSLRRGAWVSPISGITYNLEKDRHGNLIEQPSGNPKITFSHDSLLDNRLKNQQCQLNRADNGSGLCVCCRLFGTSPKGEGGQEQAEAAFAGKVQISDAIACGVIQDNQVVQVNLQNQRAMMPHLCERAYIRQYQLSNPKPHHEPFYVENRRIRGRKFYHHHTHDQLSRQREDIEMEVVKPDVIFGFTVDFQNLTGAELGLICLALELEGRCHKIGQGKPIGLGSVKIQINSVELLDPAQRFRSFDSPLAPIPDARQQLAQWIQECRDDATVFYADGWDALCAIYDSQAAKWNPKYPSRDWFQAHSGDRLPHPQDLSNPINRFDDTLPPASGSRRGRR